MAGSTSDPSKPPCDNWDNWDRAFRWGDTKIELELYEIMDKVIGIALELELDTTAGLA